jgi:hypothetical protein
VTETVPGSLAVEESTRRELMSHGRRGRKERFVALEIKIR